MKGSITTGGCGRSRTPQEGVGAQGQTSKGWDTLVLDLELTPEEVRGARQERGGPLEPENRCFPEAHRGWANTYIGVQAVQPGHWPLLLGHHASCHAPEPGPARKCLCLLHQHLV